MYLQTCAVQYSKGGVSRDVQVEVCGSIEYPTGVKPQISLLRQVVGGRQLPPLGIHSLRHIITLECSRRISQQVPRSPWGGKRSEAGAEPDC